MCYIMIAKQIGDENLKAEAVIRKILLDKADINDDGFFLKNGEWEMRTLDEKAAFEAIGLLPINNLMAHFRMASAGKVSELNVHGWQKGDWQFFHNGGVTEYASFGSAREQEKADSLQFFADLQEFVESITTRKSKKFDRQVEAYIRDMASSTNFHGRAALYYAPMDKMYLFGDFEVYTLASNYMIISSAKLDLHNAVKRTIHGFDIEYGNTAIVGEFSTEGIGVINNFSENGFNYKFLGALKDPDKPYVYGRRIRPEDEDDDWGQPHMGFENDNEWEENEFGVWVKKNPAPTSSSPTLPVPVHTPSCDVVTMADSIKDQMQRLADEGGVDLSMLEKKETSQAALELDWTDEDADKYTPEQIDELILEKIQEEWGYIGVEIETGYELYLAKDGKLHDMMNTCCRDFTCQKYDDWSIIEFNEPVMQPSLQLGFDNARG